ncbi:MAG: hypothetical protein IKC40_00960, partial [Oscillospiraceae bacterium]|nr:hypothetical protein [Oscillospiraceae bacterium]
MQIFLIRDTKSNSVHATDTKKRTGCGINLQKPENMAKFSISGSVDDAFGLMTEVTCEKCQTVFTKRILKADRKEMDRMLKEEKKRTKILGDDPNMVSLADVQKERQKQEAKKAAAEARAAARKAEAEAEAARRAAEAPVVPEVPAAPVSPVVTEVPGVAEVPTFTPPEPKFTQYVPPAKKETPKPAGPAPTTTSYGGFALGDLAQFALPQTAVDPTAAAFAANEGKNPNILAQQQNTPAPPMPAPAPAGVMSNPNDILAQFSMPAPAPQNAPAQDDTLAQFAVPAPAEAPAAEKKNESIDDIMAQFGIPATPAEPAKTETVDDILAQFNVQNAPAEAPTVPEAPVV